MTTVVLNTVTRKVEVFSSTRDVQARAEIADHKAAADPHPQYLADADLAEVALSGDAGDLASGTVPDARMPNWTGYNLASRTALEAANVPAAIDGLRLLGHAAVGDGGGARYKRVASEPAHPYKIQSADGAWWEEFFAVDVTVSIPSDFATLQDAIDRLSKQPVRQGARIIINIQSGHALTAGLTIENGDYSHFTITSDDAEVTLDAGWTAGDHVAKFTNCRAPNWGILVDCGNKNISALGALQVDNNSSLYILDGCGAKNAGVVSSDTGTGLFVGYNSQVYGSQTVFSGCASSAVQITHASRAWLERGVFTNSASSNAAVFLSRGSILYAAGANFSASTGDGIRVARSIAVLIPHGANNTVFDNNGTYAINAQFGSWVMAHERNGFVVAISNCTTHGVQAAGGSFINLLGATFSTVAFDGMRIIENSKVSANGVVMTGVGRDAIVSDGGNVHVNGLSAVAVGGIALKASYSGVIAAVDAICTGALGLAAVLAEFGGKVSCEGINVSNAAAIGLYANNGGEIIAPNSTGTGCGTYGVRADKGGEVIAPGSNYSGATTNGALASEGSRMTLTSTDVQKGVATDPTDLAISRGSIVSFWSGTGGTNVTVNTLAANGIIFK